MASINLPRVLEDYFAFAETEPTREGRRFSITLPYLDAHGRLDRLQWWYQLPAAKEQVLGENALGTVRAEAVERFQHHIQQWLLNTDQVLCGASVIPSVLSRFDTLNDGAAAAPQPPYTPEAKVDAGR